MCTFAAKRLTAVILVEWNWNCTGVETYPVSDQTLFSARAGVAAERMMLDGMIEHFFAPFPPSDFQLCSSHTPLTPLDLTLSGGTATQSTRSLLGQKGDRPTCLLARLPRTCLTLVVPLHYIQGRLSA